MLEAGKQETEEELLELALSGCANSFEELVTRYERKVFTTALYLTRNRAQAEEVLYQVFSMLRAKLSADASKEVLFDWLMQVTLDTAVRVLIEQSDEDTGCRTALNAFETHCAEFLSHNHELAHTLSGVICELPLSLRTVIVLRDILGLPLTKIAAILCINVFDAGRRLRESRLALLASLETLLGEEVVTDACFRA